MFILQSQNQLKEFYQFLDRASSKNCLHKPRCEICDASKRPEHPCNLRSQR